MGLRYGSARGRKEKAKGVWNSLEIAKLFMSAMTPLVVLGVGAVLSAQSARQAEKRADDDKANARFASVVDKRAAIWEKIGPMIIEIKRHSEKKPFAYPNVPEPLEQNPMVENDIAQCLVAMEVYKPYFSPEFNQIMDAFLQTADRIQRLKSMVPHIRKDRPDFMRINKKLLGYYSMDSTLFFNAMTKQLSLELGVSDGKPMNLGQKESPLKSIISSLSAPFDGNHAN